MLANTSLLVYIIQCFAGFHIYKPIASQIVELYPDKKIYLHCGFWFALDRCYSDWLKEHSYINTLEPIASTE
jgi:hypothetical protein